jgi:hypothetical protein
MSHEFTFFWHYDPGSSGESTAECTLNYIPECRGYGAHPDEPENVELLDVTIAGQSIYTLLNKDHIAQIEMLALERHGADLLEMAAERSIERYQERRWA